MSLSNKSAVLLFIAVLTLSVFMAPVGPVARAEASSPALSPATQDAINDWYDTVASPGFSPDIDATLASWLETGIVADEMVTTEDGVSALVVVTPSADMDAIREVVSVDYFVNLNYFKTLKVTMDSPEALAKLADIEGVGIIDADTWRFPLGDDLVKELDIAPTLPEDGVDMEEIYDIVNADGTAASGYNGSGITIGHIDTGADFGNPELQSSYNTGSYDPTGEGITPMWYYANASAVSNVTAWLEDGNLLTYVDGDGDVMLNVTGWDPLLNNGGGGRYLYGDGGPTSPYNARVGFIWLYAYFWGIDINETWLESTKMDWELPDTSNVETGTHYQVNWIFQQQTGPYAKIFAPALVWNSSADQEYKLSINWDETNAWNWLWTGGFYYETLNMSYDAPGSDLDTIKSVMDWNFTDDIVDDGAIYDLSNPIVAFDYTDDGVDDFSLGTLSWCYDAFGFTEWGDYDQDPMFQGFSANGDFCLLWDDGSHGTATAAHLVADGLYDWVDPNTNDSIVMKGIAPGADVISIRGLSGATDYFSYIWCAGFHMTNETSGEFTYTGDHMADLVTNSWGWITEPSSQMNYLAFTWEILANPDVLADDYPGVLHVFSAGNEGSGYMTIGPPGAATNILTVGASTASDWLEYLYGETPTPKYEGIASFSSRGPSFTGYPKPDVLAPGLADYSLTPWYYNYYEDVWNGGPYGDQFETGVNVTLFSGTSQAAPVAAGVAALLMEAMNFDSGGAGTYEAPWLVKLILQSTAVDLGYDPATQGFGRIDAEAAIDFWAGGYIGGTLDSALNYVDLIGDAWAYWGILPSSYLPANLTRVNSSEIAFPAGNYDGSVFFGQVMPGETVYVNYTVWDENLDVVTADWSGASDAYKYVNASTYTFTGTTFSYNDTVTYAWPDSQMYGYYNISEELGTDYATLMTADMITIIVAFDAADVAGAEPWMFLYEWDDKNDDGMPNLYNATSAEVGMGDELDRLTSASDASNVNMMTWAGDMSIENMTLVIHDPIHDVNMTATGNDFTVTLVGWDRTVDSDISFADVTPTTSTLNISLTAPDDVGIHTGFLDIGGNLWVPYAYNVVFNITDGDGAKNVVFDGFGDELEPYDNTVYGAMDEDPDDWDFRSYVLYNPYDDATYLGLRAVWDNPDNDMFLHVLDSENNDVATSSAETDTTTALLGEIDGKGYYYVLVHPLAVDGTGALPGNFTLEAMVYDELTDQPVILSYTANDVTYTPVADGDTLTGDHVVINATYPSFDLANMPEFEIDSMQIGFLSGVFYQGTGDLPVPDASYDPFSGPVQLDQFAFEFVPGIVEGDTVDITVDFSNGDCDIMVWWAGTDNTTWSYGNNLVADQMATGAHPEVGSFVADQDGTLAVGVFNYDLTAGATYEVTVDTRVGVYESAAGATVTYDTYDLERNGTFQVQILATTETNIGFEVNLAELTFENYFSPMFQSVDVTGAGAVKTITWVVTDQNAADNHTFEVLLSADDGVSYQLIATGLEALTFDWDSTGFAIDNYTILVRVTDSYGLTDEIESDPFDAGTVEVTTDTDTDTDTDTGPPPPPIPLLWIGLIGGIGVGVVVILILFLVKKR